MQNRVVLSPMGRVVKTVESPGLRLRRSDTLASPSFQESAGPNKPLPTIMECLPVSRYYLPYNTIHISRSTTTHTGGSYASAPVLHRCVRIRSHGDPGAGDGNARHRAGRPAIAVRADSVIQSDAVRRDGRSHRCPDAADRRTGASVPRTRAASRAR